jgi:predicted DNA-binding protein
MPKKRESQPLQVWLASEDRFRLEELAKRTGRTKSELARRGIQLLLESEADKENQERDSEIAKALKRMEDRIASLIARTAIDVGTIYQVLWHRSDPAKRQNLFVSARTQAINRLRQKLVGEEVEIKRKLADAIDSKNVAGQ